MPMPASSFPFGQPFSDILANANAEVVTSGPTGSYTGEPHSWFSSPMGNAEPQQSSGRRVSFGSVFNESDGNGHGSGGNGHGSAVGTTQQMRTSGSTFNIDIKPKEPPIFYGRAAEDIDTWLSKVADFIYLTEANERQQVAYMATLLQEAAADWWTALLKERHGVRPADFVEMSVLLQKRFGSTTRVDRARAALRNIKQG